MKLTKRTTPQARDYQCDNCKSILGHKDMYDINQCENCWDKEQSNSEPKENKK